MKKLVSIILITLVAGCATAPSENEVTLRRMISESIPVCTSPKECEVKWAAARSWIIQNAGWKLQHVQPDFMETYNSINSSTRLAVRVVKEPLQNGGYKITATVWCDNWISCYPDKLDALLSFNNTVNGSWKTQ